MAAPKRRSSLRVQLEAWSRARSRGRTGALLVLLLVAACGGRSARSVIARGGVGAGGGAAGGGGTNGLAGTFETGGLGHGSGGSSAGGLDSMAGATGEGGEGAPPHPCVPTEGTLPEFAECDGSFVHRPDSNACPLSPRTGDASASSGGTSNGGAPSGACASDLDCQEEPRGYCVSETHYTKLEVRCVYACRTNTDCAANEICACDRTYVDFASQAGLSLGICQPAGCVTDAECGDGLLCISPVQEECGPGHVGSFHCQTWDDECAGPGDCTQGAACVFTDGRFACESQLVC